MIVKRVARLIRSTFNDWRRELALCLALVSASVVLALKTEKSRPVDPMATAFMRLQAPLDAEQIRAQQDAAYLASLHAAAGVSRSLEQFGTWITAGSGAAILVFLQGFSDLSPAMGKTIYQANLLLLTLGLGAGALNKFKGLQLEAARKVREDLRGLHQARGRSDDEDAEFRRSLVHVHPIYMKCRIRRIIERAPRTLEGVAKSEVRASHYQLALVAIQLIIVVLVSTLTGWHLPKRRLGSSTARQLATLPDHRIVERRGPEDLQGRKER